MVANEQAFEALGKSLVDVVLPMVYKELTTNHGPKDRKSQPGSETTPYISILVV